MLGCWTKVLAGAVTSCGGGRSLPSEPAVICVISGGDAVRFCSQLGHSVRISSRVPPLGAFPPNYAFRPNGDVVAVW
jgi:hypothetical protein